jgi:hypothetical protein
MMGKSADRLSGASWTRRKALGFLGAGAAFSLGVADAAKAPSIPKGAVIRTLFKDIAPETITGEILFHEHLSIDYNRTERQLKLPPPSTTDRGQVADLKEVARAGVQLVVDGGHPDMGRNMDQLKQIARDSGMYIVASTGFLYGEQLSGRHRNHERRADCRRAGAPGER